MTALLIRSSFLHAKLLTNITNWKFCSVSGSKFAEIVQNDHASTQDSIKSVSAASPDRRTQCLNSEAGNSEGDNGQGIKICVYFVIYSLCELGIRPSIQICPHTARNVSPKVHCNKIYIRRLAKWKGTERKKKYGILGGTTQTSNLYY